MASSRACRGCARGWDAIWDQWIASDMYSLIVVDQFKCGPLDALRCTRVLRGKRVCAEGAWATACAGGVDGNRTEGPATPSAAQIERAIASGTYDTSPAERATRRRRWVCGMVSWPDAQTGSGRTAAAARIKAPVLSPCRDEA